MNLDGFGVLRRENIKGLRYKQKSSRMLSHFTYTLIFDKFDDYCFQHGVRVEKVSPTCTSQRCSKCSYVRKTNRRGKLFKCVSCNFECDSDVNASLNISFDLPFIGKVERLTRKNLKGFYLYDKGKEPIVSSTERV